MTHAKILTLATYLIFFLTVASLLVVLFGQKNQQLENRNARRLADLETYFSVIEQTTQERLGLLPGGISVLPRQIGTAETGCMLETTHCQVLSDSCINQKELQATPSGALSADIVAGTTQRTHYVVSREDANTVKLQACADEIVEPIILRKKITNKN